MKDLKLHKVNRVMLFGLPGSGKSTYATKLAHLLNLPIYHLDKYFYVENWKERDSKEFLDIQQSLIDQPRWVIDGNSMKSLEMRFQKVDLAIYFHYPVWLCLGRTIKRSFQKDWHISDLADGCTKNVSLKLLKYLVRFHHRYYPYIKYLCEKYPMSILSLLDLIRMQKHF